MSSNLRKIWLVALLTILSYTINAQKIVTPADPEYYAMDREDIGEATLKNLHYKGRVFRIQLTRKTFSVYEGEKLIATDFYGESVNINL